MPSGIARNEGIDTMTSRLKLYLDRFWDYYRELQCVMEKVVEPLSRNMMGIPPMVFQESAAFCKVNQLPMERVFESCFQRPPFSLSPHLWDKYIAGNVHPVDLAWLKQNPYLLQMKQGSSAGTLEAGPVRIAHTKIPPYTVQVLNTGFRNNEFFLDIGYYLDEFSFPVLSEGGRVWMSIAPSEIYTMEPSISKAQGNVLVFGCGLAYYAYRASQMDSVENVTVIERNPRVIHLYEKYLSPLLGNPEKIRMIEADAFQYLDSLCGKTSPYTYAFVDIWQSSRDGIPMYLEFLRREREHPEIIFDYWIEEMLLGSLCQTAGYILASELTGKRWNLPPSMPKEYFHQWMELAKNLDTPEQWDNCISALNVKRIFRELPLHEGYTIKNS